ncbi:core-2/I-branching enzyme-domain-containing protein [Entophlyctis helioformis]|nr:core-2/I-branching enzyme-domain-containing protein [Entophlyctis helioformis]
MLRGSSKVHAAFGAAAFFVVMMLVLATVRLAPESDVAEVVSTVGGSRFTGEQPSWRPAHAQQSSGSIRQKVAAAGGQSGVQRVEGTTVVHGFRFCTPLEGSVVWNNVTIASLNSTLDSLPAEQRSIVAATILDTGASSLFTKMMAWNAERDPTAKPMASDLLRFTCLMAAHSKNMLVNQASSQWIRQLSTAYFPMFTFDKSSPYLAKTLHLSHGTGTPNAKSCTLKPHFKIVFNIIAHERLDIIRRQFQALYDDDALFVYHIDAKQAGFNDELLHWILTDPAVADKCNVLLLGNPVEVHWGHGTIVQAQLESAFQALELAGWDYIINLSAYDYPLKTVPDMHKILELSPGKSYIEYLSNLERNRVHKTNILSEAKGKLSSFHDFWREYPFDDTFPLHKHHQWMILSRRFIETLRTDPDAMILSAWMEHTFIPDEAFYITWALGKNSPVRHDIVDDMHRFLDMCNGCPHPEWLKLSHTAKFTESHFLVRKMDPVRDVDLAKWMDDRRLHVTSWPNATESTTAV